MSYNFVLIEVAETNLLLGESNSCKVYCFIRNEKKVCLDQSNILKNIEYEQMCKIWLANGS